MYRPCFSYLLIPVSSWHDINPYLLHICYWVFVFDLIFSPLFDILVISTIEEGSAEDQCPSTSDTTILISRVFLDGQT